MDVPLASLGNKINCCAQKAAMQKRVIVLCSWGWDFGDRKGSFQGLKFMQTCLYVCNLADSWNSKG